MRTSEVRALTGATDRQLHHWVHKGYIPDVDSNVGSGMPREWSPRAVRCVAFGMALSEMGVLMGASKWTKWAFGVVAGAWRDEEPLILILDPVRRSYLLSSTSARPLAHPNTIVVELVAL